MVTSYHFDRTASEEVTLKIIKSKCLPLIWLRSMPSNCVGPAFTGFCYKQILYEIILHECYGHGKNVPRLF